MRTCGIRASIQHLSRRSRSGWQRSVPRVRVVPQSKTFLVPVVANSTSTLPCTRWYVAHGESHGGNWETGTSGCDGCIEPEPRLRFVNFWFMGMRPTLLTFFSRCRGVELILCGHSLGAGVAALLALVSNVDYGTSSHPFNFIEDVGGFNYVPYCLIKRTSR